MKITKQQFNQLQYENNDQRGAECFDHVIDTLRRAVLEVERYKDDYKNQANAKDKADRLSWAVNHMASNVLGNCRLDIMVLVASELGRTEPQA